MIIRHPNDFVDTYPTQPPEIMSKFSPRKDAAHADDWREQIDEFAKERASWLAMHRIAPDAQEEDKFTAAGYRVVTRLCIAIAVVLVLAILWGH